MEELSQNEIFKQLELKHIQLELQAGRLHHIKHFIDPYFCYEHGYINSKGNADTDMVMWKEYISEEALQYFGSTDTSIIVKKEHIVPSNIIQKELQELGKSANLDQIEQVLDKYLIFATITKEEDHKLNAHKLKQKLPDSYYDPSQRLYGNKFSRYIEAGVVLYRQFDTPNESVFGRMNLYEVNPCPVGSYYWPEDIWEALQQRLNDSVFPTLQKIDRYITTSELAHNTVIKYDLHLEKWHKEVSLNELFQVILKYCELNLDRGILAEIWINEKVNNRFFLLIEPEEWCDKSSEERHDVWHISFSNPNKYCIAEKMSDSDINKEAKLVIGNLKDKS